MAGCNEGVEKLFHSEYLCPSITDGTQFRSLWASIIIIDKNPGVRNNTEVNRLVMVLYQGHNSIMPFYHFVKNN